MLCTPLVWHGVGGPDTEKINMVSKSDFAGNLLAQFNKLGPFSIRDRVSGKAAKHGPPGCTSRHVVNACLLPLAPPPTPAADEAGPADELWAANTQPHDDEVSPHESTGPSSSSNDPEETTMEKKKKKKRPAPRPENGPGGKRRATSPSSD